MGPMLQRTTGIIKTGMVGRGSMEARRAALLTMVTLVAVTLAGCTSAPKAAETQTTAPVDEGEKGGFVPTTEAANATQPADQSDFAKSLDEKFHTHNYWGSSLEKVLMDLDVQSGPMVPSVIGDITAYAFSISLNSGIGYQEFGIPEGNIVPPETNHVDIDIKYAPSNTITGLKLGYHTAQDVDQFTILEPMPEGGTTYNISTTLIQNDIPHTTVSKWKFELIPFNNQVPSAPGLFNGTVHVLIKAYRPDVLFIAPPHPDFWGINTTLHLFNLTGTLKGDRVILPLFIPGQTGFTFVAPPEGAIVPPHTGLLTVLLTWTQTGGIPSPFGGRVELYYQSPNTFQFAPAEPSVSDASSATFTIPVDTGMWDSPYANQSEWTFLLAMDTDAPTDQGTFFGDIGVFDGTFTMDVTAEREQVTA